MGEQFGKKKLIKDISANTLQTVITQFFGLAIFYITSKYLVKEDFGEFNWSMAVGSTILAVSSLGLDLILVRRIARGESVIVMGGMHFFHTLIVGVVLSLCSLIVNQFVPSFNGSHPFFFIVFLNLAIANMANSFKLCLNGLESYKQLALLALVANVFKFLLIIVLYVFGQFTILNVIYAYAATSALEFATGYFLLNNNIAALIKPQIKIVDYKYFILESLPQLGVVLFDSALARIDWILLGILSTAAVTAEYSFVYRVFELSKLPLLIIAPILLTRFSKLFNTANKPTDNQINDIQLFLKLELSAMLVIPVILVSCWTPLMDYLTNNKYGIVNEISYNILSICVPLACLINFMWTVGFVQGQLKTILKITIVVSLVNILANVVMIPLYAGVGAALSFLFSSIIQLVLYIGFIKTDKIKFGISTFVLPIANGFLAIIISKLLVNNVIFNSLLSVCLYLGLVVLTRQFNLADVKKIIKTK